MAKVLHSTKKLDQEKQVLDFDYIGSHFYKEVNDDIIEYLLTQNLCLEVYGFPPSCDQFKENGNEKDVLASELVKSSDVLQSEDGDQKKESDFGMSTNVNAEKTVDLINDYNSKLLNSKNQKGVGVGNGESGKKNEKKDSKKKKKSGFFSFFGL